MINDQEARKNVAPEAIADARRLATRFAQRRPSLSQTGSSAEEAAGRDDRDRLPVAEDRARDNYDLSPTKSVGKLPHNPITRDDLNNRMC
jgi:hypothetical protein